MMVNASNAHRESHSRKGIRDIHVRASETFTIRYSKHESYPTGSLYSVVSVQKCHNAPICGLFAKPTNFIFKFLSLKNSLIQADCHWKQVLVVRSTIFHSLKQKLEILSERDSNLLASLDKGIVHRRSQCTLNTAEEQ